MAIHMGCKKVIFESDSKEIVEEVNRSSSSNMAVHNILKACNKELSRLESWQVTWIAREQNHVADLLAAMSSDVDKGIHILTEPPVAILGPLEDDMVGLPCWRNSFGSS